MKAALLSIHPRYCEKIASGKKTVEVRKNAPKIQTPFKCYIYETQSEYVKYQRGAVTSYGYGRGKVIGEFVCDEIYEWKYECDGVDIDDETLLDTMLEWEEINIYAHGKTLHGWHISGLKIYDKPKELGKFRKACGLGTGCEDCDDIYFTNCKNALTRPPQSWCYVEEV